MPPSRPSAVEEPDGRVRRGVRNRNKILDAMVELVREGDLMPTADRVAARASVGTRTVFRHFDDMEGLLAEMSRRVESEIQPLSTPEGGNLLEDRVRALVVGRALFYEHIAPFKRSGNLQRWRSQFLQKNHQRLVRMLRVDLTRALPELDGAPDAVLDAVELLASFEAWERLRLDQRLSRERAQKTVEEAITRLLTR